MNNTCKYHIALVPFLIVSVLTVASCKGKNATLESMYIAPASQTVSIGTVVKYTATAVFTDKMSLTWTLVTWSSSDPNVASVDANGFVTALNNGTAIITATDEYRRDIAGSATFNVWPINSVSVTPTSPFIVKGTALQLISTATLTSYPLTSTQDVTSLMTMTWTSSDAAVATVGATGIVYAGSSAGTTTITATDAKTGTGKSASIQLTVLDTPLVTIAVTTPSLATIVSGTTLQLTATGNCSGNCIGSPTIDLTSVVQWNSLNYTVATVNSKGLATLYTAGTTTITATELTSNVSGSTVLTVQ